MKQINNNFSKLPFNPENNIDPKNIEYNKKFSRLFE